MSIWAFSSSVVAIFPALFISSRNTPICSIPNKIWKIYQISHSYVDFSTKKWCPGLTVICLWAALTAWYFNSQCVYFLLLCVLMREHLIAQFGTHSSNPPVYGLWALVCVWLLWEKEDKLVFFPPIIQTIGTLLSCVNFKMRGKLLVKGCYYKITVHCSKLASHYPFSNLVLDGKDGTNYDQTIT